ncbi:hypothetical protein [Acetivibrio saccincola]|jgi:hypothetical protein|uniref:Uncharacterized protein n=1 Tax=Acetivibrio saccincola TaxID=1677857 RepID=A0A2S8R7C3_9FIRM|nr:hypothetical protein [Acetivibrio saccincola]PQQ65693.1 hypothetical protein B9R14_02185 [Acetivibrio saccincola]
MELVFSGFGIEIIKREGKFFVRYDSGETVSNMIEKEITEDEAIKAQKSEKDAYEVLLLRERRP